MLEITYIFAELFEPLIMRLLNLGFLTTDKTWIQFKNFTDMKTKRLLYESPEMVFYNVEVQGCIASSVTDSASGTINGFDGEEIEG